MKTTILDNVISKKELFFMYSELINCQNWSLKGYSTDHIGFMHSPLLMIKGHDELIKHYPFYLWGQTIIYRIEKLLENKNIGIPTTLKRMWFNSTYHGKKTQHWFHKDAEKNYTSILLFMTPVWQPDWRGSFYIDGEEFKFKPGSAVIFNSKEYHKGESPASEIYNWQRITCNILVGEND